MGGSVLVIGREDYQRQQPAARGGIAIQISWVSDVSYLDLPSSTSSVQKVQGRNNGANRKHNYSAALVAHCEIENNSL